jgi:hypothetical protein
MEAASVQSGYHESTSPQCRQHDRARGITSPLPAWCWVIRAIVTLKGVANAGRRRLEAVTCRDSGQPFLEAFEVGLGLPQTDPVELLAILDGEEAATAMDTTATVTDALESAGYRTPASRELAHPA